MIHQNTYFDIFRDNFSKDKFLISQLDSDQYISIEVIAQLKAVASLSTNIPLILEILKSYLFFYMHHFILFIIFFHRKFKNIFFFNYSNYVSQDIFL